MGWSSGRLEAEQIGKAVPGSQPVQDRKVLPGSGTTADVQVDGPAHRRGARRFPPKLAQARHQRHRRAIGGKARGSVCTATRSQVGIVDKVGKTSSFQDDGFDFELDPEGCSEAALELWCARASPSRIPVY